MSPRSYAIVRAEGAPLKITPTLLTSIHRHLEAGYPHEACGVMLGQDETVTEIIPALNHQTDRPANRYLIDPREYDRIERDADQRGLQVAGIYHSHPDAPPQPSAFDLEHAWPYLSYLIVSVVAGRAGETQCWRLREQPRQFDPEPICSP